MFSKKRNSRYASAPLDIQLKVPLLRGVLIVIALLTSFLIISSFRTHMPLMRSLSYFMFLVFVGLGLWGLNRGKYSLVSNIFFPIMEGAMFLQQISRGYEETGSAAGFAFILGSFLVFSAVFITNRKLLYTLCALYFLSYPSYLGFIAYPGARAAGDLLETKHTVFPFIAVSSISVGLVSFRLIFDRVVSNAIGAMEESRTREQLTRNLTKSSAQQMAKAESLLAGASETSDAARVIGENIHAIDERFDILNSRVERANDALGHVKHAASQMTELAREQALQAEESGGAVEEMVNSVGNVTSVIAARVEGVNELTGKARSGESQVKETLEAFDKVHHLLDGIQNLAGVISDIADQTNLLAMNASIQAAHAGEAGKGFAVVAGEVRTLSESTSQSAGNIATNISDLLAAISQVGRSLDLTLAAFGDISREIDQFARAIGEIDRNARELESGSRGILNTTASLRQLASRVDEQSREVSSAQESIHDSIVTISTLSAEISEETKDISRGAGRITASMEDIHELADELVEGSRTLNKEMDI
ncbi:MAG: methyl-accepting chemotaxis protein [Spirochaetales bacterium]|nr:methyl-accepting chemotaxis protein [Spirochaetales bacterium]